MSDDTTKRDPGSLRGDGLRVCIVASRFNDFIVARLIDGAEDGLVRLGVARRDITVLRAPGAFELPALCRRAAASKAYDVVLALGCVIRGATPHFDYVAGECAKGVASVAFEASLHGTAVIFGVLTTNTIEQAVERAGTKAGNKGFDAALAAIETVRALRAIPIQEPR